VTGPDGRLYAGTSEGSIFRFDVAADGTLSNPLEITALRAAGPRLLIGMAFAPGTGPTQPTLWVSHSTYGFAAMPDWGGTISRLSGPNLGTVTDEVVKLPRSAKDHLVNSLAFGPDGALYTSQGANSAAGDLDPRGPTGPNGC
jgi:glucose/arabinose dehydrogenase